MTPIPYDSEEISAATPQGVTVFLGDTVRFEGLDMYMSQWTWSGVVCELFVGSSGWTSVVVEREPHNQRRIVSLVAVVAAEVVRRGRVWREIFSEPEDP